MATLGEIYQTFQFTPSGQQALLLNGALESYEDSIPSRMANFEYLKRDGAETEPMGAGQKRFSFRCVFMGGAPITVGGPSIAAGSRYQQLVKALLQQPLGALVHPRLGKFNVGFTGLRAREEPSRAVDSIDFTIEFAENQVDAVIASTSIPVPQQQGGRVLALNAELVEALNVYSSYQSAIVANIAFYSNLFTNSSAAFVTAAVAAAQNQEQDLALTIMLGDVLTQQNAFLAALTASTAYTLQPDILLTPYRVSARQIYSECVRLYYSVVAQKPPPVPFIVPALMPLTLISNRLGVRNGDLLALNRIPNPFAVPMGFKMIVPAQVVRA
jgi:hypothetical protein